MLWKILIGVVLLVALIVGATFAAPMLVPKDWLRNQVTAQVRAATGRDLTIDGDFGFRLLPTAVVVMENVRFANVEGGSRPDMARLNELRVHVATLPLLSSQVEVKEFVLVEPDILLEVDREGRANWTLGSDTAADGAADARPAESGGRAGPGLDSLKLGDVRVVNGRVEYRDARSGTVETLENVDVTLSLPDIDSPLAVDGGFAWNGQALTLRLAAEQPRALSEGNASPVSLALKGAPLDLTFDGSLDSGALEARGKLALDVPSVRGLAEWAGSPLAAEGEVLGPLRVGGQLAASPDRVDFSGMSLALDDLRATGDLSTALAGAVPSVKATLAMEALDLNPYLAAFSGGGDDGGASATPRDGAAAPGWSDEPIDFSALRSLNADLSLTLGSLTVKEIETGESAVTVALNGGKLQVDLSKLALYDGSGVASLTVDASGETPAIAHSLQLTGLQARPFLIDAAQTKWLSGTAATELRLTTRGKSQKAMVGALNGNGKFAFLDGSIYGINLAAMLRNAGTAFLAQSTEEVKTDFAELSGTFTIKDGLVSNDDLQMLSPLLRVTGAGTANMPQRTVNYRIEPKAVASLEGQGGSADQSGIAVPVIVEGSWDKPTFRPDLAGAVSDIARDPAKALEGARDLAKDPAEALKRLAPGGQSGSGSDGSQDTSPASPLKEGAEGLKQLFGR